MPFAMTENILQTPGGMGQNGLSVYFSVNLRLFLKILNMHVQTGWLQLRKREVLPFQGKLIMGGWKIEGSRSLASAVLYGILTIFLLAVLSSTIFSLILRFTSVEESSLNIIITVVSFVSVFLGGFISGGKSKQNGWLAGGLTGIVYSLIIFLYQYLGYDSLFSLKQLIYHACCILTAAMGGIFGVNFTAANTRNA